MQVADHEVAELRRAYHTIGVPHSASAHAIKQAYRKLAKRWHPDLYVSGSVAHSEATQMMKLLNQAYALIVHAPLRYYRDIPPASPVEVSQSRNKTSANSDLREFARLNARWEFWIRFACGAMFGALLEFGALLRGWGLGHGLGWRIWILLAVGGILLAGFCAALLGDDFWYDAGGYWRRGQWF